MKRLVAVILAAVLMATVCVASASEITFSDIPWGTDVFTLERKLDEMRMPTITTMDIALQYIGKHAENKTEGLMMFEDEWTEKECGFRTYGTDLIERKETKYEGLRVLNITFMSVYGEKDGRVNKAKPYAKLFAARVDFLVDDPDNAFDSLVETFNRRYGAGEEQWGSAEAYDEEFSFITRCDMEQMVYTGDNDTYATIEKAIYKGRSKWVSLVMWDGNCDKMIEDVLSKLE